jgi:hypothetical protein
MAWELASLCSDIASCFHNRPLRVVNGEVFAQELVQQISDAKVKNMAAQYLIDNLSQWADNTSMIEGRHNERIRCLYEEEFV